MPDAWRLVRSSWRWLLGMPPLQDPGVRLADHYSWIHAEADETDQNNGQPPSPTALQRSSDLPTFVPSAASARPPTPVMLLPHPSPNLAPGAAALV